MRIFIAILSGARFNPAIAARWFARQKPFSYHVIPAKAGIYGSKGLDPRLRGDDGMRGGDDGMRGGDDGMRGGDDGMRGGDDGKRGGEERKKRRYLYHPVRARLHPAKMPQALRGY